MNLDNLSVVCSQVDTLLKSLSKEKAKTTNQELNSLIDHHGTEVLSYLLKVLITKTSNEVKEDSSNILQVAQEQPLTQLLASRIPGLLQRSDFITLIAQTYPECTNPAEGNTRNGLLINKPAEFTHLRKPIAHLDFLSKVLQLSAFQKVLFGIAFSHHNLFAEKAPHWVLQRLSEFVNQQKKNSNKNKKDKRSDRNKDKDLNDTDLPNSNNNTLSGADRDRLAAELINARSDSPFIAGSDSKIEPLKTREGYGIDGSIIPSYHTIIDFLLSSKHAKSLSSEPQTKEFMGLLRATFPHNNCPVELIPMLYPNDPEYNTTRDSFNRKVPVLNIFTGNTSYKKSKENKNFNKNADKDRRLKEAEMMKHQELIGLVGAKISWSGLPERPARTTCQSDLPERPA